MKLFRMAVISVVILSPGAAWADKGGIPNASTCNPGQASFCSAPEMDAASLPLVLGLGAALVMWRRDRRQRKTKP